MKTQPYGSKGLTHIDTHLHPEVWVKYVDVNKEMFISFSRIMTGNSLPVTGGREHNPKWKYFIDQLPDRVLLFIHFSGSSHKKPVHTPFLQFRIFILAFNWDNNIRDWPMGFYVQSRQGHRLIIRNSVFVLGSSFVYGCSSKMGFRCSPKWTHHRFL